MCGIAGFVDLARATGAPVLQATAEAMAETLAHRGPDDRGVWIDAAAGVALGHRRLAIIDLSPEGHQPMLSASGRYAVVYNGEIYNFQALRAELARLGCTFRGHSDTEVLLAAVAQWGVFAALQRFNGMFAFVLWDRVERTLYLARDRLGEKPLYYGWMGQVFLFGSELKALRAHPAFRADVSRDALALYLTYNYIPAPYAIYRGAAKLPPGTLLALRAANGSARPTPHAYWSVREAAERGVADPWRGSSVEAAAYLDALLRDAVKLRMVADVPLGAFLSGGIDSSTVVALMQAQSERPVRTFSIGFLEAGYNEAEHAKAVARHLGTDHTELYITPAEAMAVIPRLPRLYDEPFADSSQIPTFLVSELARRHVTVSLSGDGGDELFLGYPRYVWGRRIWQRIGWLPVPLRTAAAAALTALPADAWDALLGRLGPLLPREVRGREPGHKLHRLAEVLAVARPEALYERLMAHWSAPERVVPGAATLPTVLSDTRRWAALPDFTQRMMYFDMAMYLPDDILAKVDRVSMGVGLEARVPLLDHRVVELAWRLPLALKLRDGQGKWLLRQVLYRYVPRALIERPKMGFGVPVGAWLRGPLRAWAEALLAERRLRDEGFFDPQPIRSCWAEHLGGTRNWQYHLWDVLMFQAWLDETQLPAPVAPGVRPAGAPW
ncbi:MAG: asparagine synthase (glutamine-hydrolyzing) [Chloroflexi bacterium]|nr:asparagine synthase (glutamine-hydrolyzing) [Chloroflexota bacterium]